MPIVVQCPTCAKKLRAPDNMAGKVSLCPGCKTKLTVPPLTTAAPIVDLPPTTTPPSTPQPAAKTRREPAPAPEIEPDFFAVADAPALSPRVQPETYRPNASRTSAEGVPGTVPKRPALKASAAPVPDMPAFASASSSKSLLLTWLFACTLIPLAFSMLSSDSDFAERLIQTVQKHPELEDSLNLSKDEFLALVPEHRIEGAHLAHDSWGHWGYALLAACLFLAAIPFLFDRGKANIGELILAGVITATVGIFMLLCFQWIANFTQGMWVKGRSILVIVFYIIKLIGYSYRAAMDSENGFLLSFLGFTFGVGLCEELTKAVPVLVHLRGDSDHRDWRSACVWGLASGVGFGVAEGIMYSSDYYNGISTGGIYLVRFVSCVGLHAIWSASVGLMIWSNQESFEGDLEWTDWTIAMFKVLGVSMVLHGLYDTLLKKEMNALALLTAVVSFVWLMWLIHRSRET